MYLSRIAVLLRAAAVPALPCMLILASHMRQQQSYLIDARSRLQSCV